MLFRFIPVVALVLSFASGSQALGSPSPVPPTTALGADFRHTWLLHLPGIGGERGIDHSFIHGMRDGGWAGPTAIYDWTENDPGLDALRNHHRNQREAKKVAQMIQDRIRQDPRSRIVIASHSGGTGIAVWALEDLPDGIQVDDLLLLASALSPQYDLSKALSHVRGHAYVFHSSGDALVLGTGTKLFGTIDGRQSVAAGLIGFKALPDADKRQYEKLVQQPYDNDWRALGHYGDHIGCMSRAFVETIIAPILIDELSGVPPTTRPADVRARRGRP